MGISEKDTPIFYTLNTFYFTTNVAQSGVSGISGLYFDLLRAAAVTLSIIMTGINNTFYT
jgi:hypothetical protein